MVKNPPVVQETWEDPLEKELAIHSSILVLEIPWTEEPGGLHTVHRVTTNWTYSVAQHSTGTMIKL